MKPEPVNQLLKHSFGPHTGPLVKTPNELLEVSVFENAGLAFFRLYFFDHDGQPMPAPGTEVIKLETIRQGGEEEHFALRPHEDCLCLESMSKVPHPHAFRVRITINRSGQIHTCETQFQDK